MGILSNILDISGFFLIVVINLSLIALLCYYAKKKFESIEEIQKEQSKILFNLVHSASNTTVNGAERTNQIDPMFLSPPTMVIPQVNEISEENKIINMSSTGPQVINLASDSETDSDDESENESENEDEIESVDEDDSESAEEENDSDEIEDLTVNEENSLILEEIENEGNKEVLDIDVNLLKGDLEEKSKEVLLSLEEDNNEDGEENFDKMTITQLKNYISSKGKTISSKTTKKSDILEYIKLNNI